MDGAALLATAIRSAVLAHAPRRTVQAVAAAVTGVRQNSVKRSHNDPKHAVFDKKKKMGQSSRLTSGSESPTEHTAIIGCNLP